MLAETYALIDVFFFGFTLWRAKSRPAPPPPPAGLTVDVFITTYNEEIELVRRTAEAAKRIRYPHRTYVLDDGNRPAMKQMADELGIGYITRGPGWENRPLHAKAGNLNNALLQTDGEFLLILDADQVPRPQILDRTLGYFSKRTIAFVQTPQEFVNVPDRDPLGSRAPLFYGPIQQGKDGWNAAFFCGSNAVLRREALMQLGISRYVIELEQAVTTALRGALRPPGRSGSLRIARHHHVPPAADHHPCVRRTRGRRYGAHRARPRSNRRVDDRDERRFRRVERRGGQRRRAYRA